MSKILTCIILLFLQNILAQDTKFFNKTFNLKDTLNYDYEIRLYVKPALTYHITLINIYRDQSEKWHALLFKHYINDRGLYTQEQFELKLPNTEIIFFELLKFQLLDLPQEKSFAWEKEKVEIIENVKHPKDVNFEKYASQKKNSSYNGWCLI